MTRLFSRSSRSRCSPQRPSAAPSGPCAASSRQLRCASSSRLLLRRCHLTILPAQRVASSQPGPPRPQHSPISHVPLRPLQAAPRIPSRSARRSLPSPIGRALPLPSSLLHPRGRARLPPPSAMLDSLIRALGVAAPAAPASTESFIDTQPSWEELDAMLASERLRLSAPAPDLVNGPTHADRRAKHLRASAPADARD